MDITGTNEINGLTTVETQLAFNSAWPLLGGHMEATNLHGLWLRYSWQLWPSEQLGENEKKDSGCAKEFSPCHSHIWSAMVMAELIASSKLKNSQRSTSLLFKLLWKAVVKVLPFQLHSIAKLWNSLTKSHIDCLPCCSFISHWPAFWPCIGWSYTRLSSAEKAAYDWSNGEFCSRRALKKLRGGPSNKLAKYAILTASVAYV